MLQAHLTTSHLKTREMKTANQQQTTWEMKTADQQQTNNLRDENCKPATKNLRDKNCKQHKWARTWEMKAANVNCTALDYIDFCGKKVVWKFCQILWYVHLIHDGSTFEFLFKRLLLQHLAELHVSPLRQVVALMIAWDWCYQPDLLGSNIHSHQNTQSSKSWIRGGGYGGDGGGTPNDRKAL